MNGQPYQQSQNPSEDPSTYGSVQPAPEVTPAPTPDYARAHESNEHGTEHPLSHVSSRPEGMEGHNFNPQLRSQYANEPKVVHATRPYEPKKNDISEELQKKHQESVEKYPFLNLTAGEYVVLQLQRHPIGLFMPIGVACLIIILLLSVLFSYPIIMMDTANDMMPGLGLVAVVTLSLVALVGLFTYVTVWVYLRNRFFLTNESVIQELQYSLFSRREQTASLGSIEDVSYHQSGLIETMFNYGSIRLSTEGDETTYRFYYVSDPKKQTSQLTNAVEAFKNGRAVED
jgi:hypothetical protein